MEYRYSQHYMQDAHRGGPSLGAVCATDAASGAAAPGPGAPDAAGSFWASSSSCGSSSYSSASCGSGSYSSSYYDSSSANDDPIVARLDQELSSVGEATVAVLSDTHGKLDAEAFRAIADLSPDLIVHAGDICGDDIIPRLEMLAPVVAVLGNNDYPGAYGSRVRGNAFFELLGVDFQVTHYPSRLRTGMTRIAICGHTHIPAVEQYGLCTIVNPGSVSRPRGSQGPTIACVKLALNYVRSINIVHVV